MTTSWVSMPHPFRGVHYFRGRSFFYISASGYHAAHAVRTAGGMSVGFVNSFLRLACHRFPIFLWRATISKVEGSLVVPEAMRLSSC
jgi:hypothetical protein